ncbi:MAG: aminoacyl-tRNA hydrolase [Actinomycetota bacterium]|nr:aminoacyl-tRNA hydrolase [Actinomycetota bacterium]
MGDEKYLIVGLGNPGPRYAGTRHNAGFMVLDLLATRLGGRFKAHKGRADIVEGQLHGSAASTGSGAGASGVASAVLAKPKAFMNLSGGPVAAISRFYKIPVERIVVVHDELDLPFGSLRLKRGGGDGGHNGLKSISSAIGHRDYVRVRLGISRPPIRQDPADYVLREFSTAERKELGLLIDRAADAVEAVATQGLEAAQNTYNG